MGAQLNLTVMFVDPSMGKWDTVKRHASVRIGVSIRKKRRKKRIRKKITSCSLTFRRERNLIVTSHRRTKMVLLKMCHT